MNKFKPSIEEYDTDNLIFICELSPEEWQSGFVEAARIELSQRGLSDSDIQKRADEINKDFDIYLNEEKKQRETVSYSTGEIISRILFWYKYILWDWGLKKNGYYTLAKQRLLFIFYGILLYSVTIYWLSNKGDSVKVKKEAEIEQSIQEDMILNSKVDWTGTYSYTSSSKSDKQFWDLTLKKIEEVHAGVLLITTNGVENSYDIEALCTDSTVRVLPKSKGLIESFEIKSKYDLLFELVVEQEDTVTWWKNIKPNEIDFRNGEVNFKKLIAK